MGLNHIEHLINSEDMTSQTDNHLGNLCCDSHCSIVLHTFSKIHNFLISYPILLKLFLIVLSDLYALIESKLFFEWTCPLSSPFSLAGQFCALLTIAQKKLLPSTYVCRQRKLIGLPRNNRFIQ